MPVTVSNVKNANRLIQKGNPSCKLNVFFAIKNCITHVENCTHKLVNAAPLASKIGMKMKLSVRFMITPIIATRFNCFKFPFAVSSVPKMYVTDIETKLPIKICNIFDDSDILILYASIDSFSCMLYSSSIKF